MSRITGLSSFSSNFEPKISGPLDARTVVDTAADLVSESTWQAPDGTLYVYKGMLVSVVNDLTEINGVYRLAALPITSEINWVKLGTGESTGGTGILVWYPDNSPPSVPADGDAYYDTALGKSRVWSDGAWHTVANDGEDGAQGLPGEDGANGVTPHIGINGNWFIGLIDTEIPATGPAGQDGAQGLPGEDGTNGVTPHIGLNGNWFIGLTDTEIPATGPAGQDGQDGAAGVSPHIDETTGNWFIGETDTDIPATGPAGKDGSTGPAPTITMGTVTTGATPKATLTPVTGEEGTYTLDLVMPAAATFGTLKVAITGATGQWSANGGSTWHDSGDTIMVATGTYTVTFAFVDGYTTPSSQSVTISENTLSTVSAEYYEIEVPTETEGTLVVKITGASNGSWSIDSGTTWKSSGQSLLLTAGSYTITFEPILGYSKPDDISASITAGEITMKSGTYVAQPDSSDPTNYGRTWDNGTEPVLGEGAKVIYVTPNGAGNLSGDSWANAKAGLYTAGLAASNGDVLYVQEGTYTSHLAPVAATKAIGIYGGFTVAYGTWATRDNFAHPSIIDASSNPSVPFIKPESGVAQAVNGIACTGFTGGVMLANGGTATVKNCAIYDCTGVVSSHAVENCLVLDCTGGTGEATDCVFVNLNKSSGTIVAGNATDCIFLNCSVYNVVYGSASGCELENCEIKGPYGHVKDDAEDCTFTNCSSSRSDNSNSYIVGTTATNCTFTNCSSISSGYNSYIVGTTATNCTFTSCSSSGYRNSYIVGTTATNCTFTNCSSSGYSYSSYIVGTTATNCTFTNCSISSNSNSNWSYIVGTTATNCTISRCVASRLTYTTTSGYEVTNSIIWNSTITTIDFGAGSHNAASAYIDANTLVLGTDNTLAKFADLGTVSDIGYSESLNDTPAADFGDFRPLVGSILIGAGVAVSGITEDIAGNLRADPPTIGAYEYVEVEA